jgi:hypothetical protein
LTFGALPCLAQPPANKQKPVYRVSVYQSPDPDAAERVALDLLTREVVPVQIEATTARMPRRRFSPENSKSSGS